MGMRHSKKFLCNGHVDSFIEIPVPIPTYYIQVYLLVPRLSYGWLRLGIYRFVRISAIPVSQTTGHWLDLIHKPCEPATTFISQKYMNRSLNHFKPAQATRQLRGRTAFLVASKLQCCWSDSLDFSTRGLLYTLWIRFPFELTEDSG
jgi:hypothetical protein